MRFRRNRKLEQGLELIDIAPMIDVVFLLLVFFIFSPALTFRSGISVKLPKALTSDTIKEEDFIITITGENVIYLNDKVTAAKDLEQILGMKENKSRPILIKADRHASVGRIVDVWNLCRNLGIEKINIATDQGN